jgi:hypothetical protein
MPWIAYIKSVETGQWYNFNDTNVSFITEDDVRKMYGNEHKTGANAYMLMYR